MMTDHPQGGAVVEDGTIELMHNRRLLFADSGAQTDPLNETDIDGYPIQVNATYYMHIFDTENSRSLQRYV